MEKLKTTFKNDFMFTKKQIKYVVKGYSSFSIYPGEGTTHYLSPLFDTRKEAEEELRKNGKFYRKKVDGKVYIEAEMVEVKEASKEEKERLRNLSKTFNQISNNLTRCKA